MATSHNNNYYEYREHFQYEDGSDSDSDDDDRIANGEIGRLLV